MVYELPDILSAGSQDLNSELTSIRQAVCLDGFYYGIWKLEMKRAGEIHLQVVIMCDLELSKGHVL